MSEPISTTKAVAAVSALTLIPGADPAAVIGAFTGAVLFIMSNDQLSTVKRIGLFLVSFLGGLVCADWSSILISNLLPDSLQISSGMGALIASACVVRLVQYLMNLMDDPKRFLAFIRGTRGK
ncbi:MULTISPECIES: putative holin [Pseudoalteromonas]|uniref:putative holin n=1 Tax=Pseudoalteromonas TaxID=53246 RepID=UPI0006B5EBD4|nr:MULTISPECIES: putative holin [Pseudoalteromonas]AZZ98013.1 alkaline phosphatase [Pseudoalteromonas sp. R3]MEC4090146.1 putative holin [Pseudoalteromonas rubra]